MFVLNGRTAAAAASLLRAPESWSLKTIRAHGRDVTDEPLSFGTEDESLTEVEIVLRTGRWHHRQRHRCTWPPVADYTIVVFAARHRGIRVEILLTSHDRRRDGNILGRDLPPGEYVAAVDGCRAPKGLASAGSSVPELWRPSDARLTPISGNRRPSPPNHRSLNGLGP